MSKLKKNTGGGRPEHGRPSYLELEQELAWTRFSFELEEKLGCQLEPEQIFQIFSDLLKTQFACDYIEISLLGHSGNDEIPLTDWVRNDTGYGGKLLSIILAEEFLHGLRWRRNPLPVNLEEAAPLITNPELLRVMNLNTGILVPICQGKCSYGVVKIFFCRQVQFPANLQAWLTTCGSILCRALKRAYLYQKAQKMATIDGLTGLYNHRYFMEQLGKEFQRARRYRNWLALIVIDIDFFKYYNDANGHLAGDRALKKVAQTIKSSVREIDLVARWGGEEFALLLPENNLENGLIVAEKIRKEVETQRFKNERKQPNGSLTISLGVAQNSAQLKNHREMFNLADAALYRAKLEGRNRCASAK